MGRVTKLGKAARHLKPTSVRVVCSQGILPQPENEASIRKDHSQSRYWYVVRNAISHPFYITISQLVKKFPTFYGTQRFTATLTSACYLPLS